MGQSVLEISPADDAATIAPLVLGHRNGPQAGEIIQLTRPKCYLGAGGLSTSVSPKANLSGVHCLILRGPEHTVVRRWSPSVRLNGQPFDDATLQCGDRLQLGAIDLEVLSDAEAETLAEWRLLLSDLADSRREAREPVNQSREDELARRAAGLERNEFELQQKSEQTWQLAEELHRRQVMLDTLAGEVCVRENELKRQEAANAQLRIELDAQAEALDCINERLNQKRAKAESEQTRLTDELRDRTAAWEAQQAAAVAILTARETAITLAETRIAQRDVQAAAMSPSENVHADLDQERQRIERDRLLVEQSRAELEQARHEINTQREQLLHEQRLQEQSDSATAGRAAKLEQAEAERVERCEVLEKQRAQLEIEVRQLEEQRAAFAAAQQAAAHAQAETIAVTDRARSEAEAIAAVEQERSRSALADLQQQIVGRESQLEERLAAYSAERAELAAGQEECENLQRDLQTQQQVLAERDSELAQRREGLEQQLVEHQRRLEQLATKELQLTERAAELDAIAASQVERLESQRDELARSQSNFAAECSARQRELEAMQARLEAAQRQHGESTDEVERQRVELAIRQATLDEQLSELTSKVDEVTRRERLLAEQEQPSAERETTPNPITTATPTEVEILNMDSASPESTEAVFRRLGVMSLLRESPEEIENKDCGQSALAEATTASLAVLPRSDELADALPDDLPGEQEQEVAATALPAQPGDLDEGDESQIIERYMSQLLSRVRGGKADAHPAATFVRPAKKSNPATTESPADRANPSVEITSCECPTPTKPEPSAPIAPRHSRPSSSDISAMRDLANQSAQAAIGTHDRGILLNDLYVKTIVCLTGLVAGIVLLSWVPQIGWIGLLAGAACFVGSGVWGIQLGMLLREFLNASGTVGLDDSASDTESTIIASAHHLSTELNEPAN